MSNIPITSLPLATALDGSEEVPIVQGGTTKRTTTGDIGNTATGFVPTSRTISTPTPGGLTGGGSLASDLVLNWAPANLNIKSAMVVADTFAINDSSLGDPAQTTFPNAMKALTGLSALGIPDLLNDYLIINSSADGETYKINPSALSLASGNVPAGGLSNQFLAKISNVDYDTTWTDPAIVLDALSISANPTGSSALSTSVTLGSTLAFSGTELQTGAGTGDVSWSANSFTTTIGANKVTDGMLRQSAGLSVIGRSASSTGDVADIVGTSDQVLRVAASGASLGFGSIDLSKSAAVGASVLAATNGGTGLSSYTLGDIIYSSASNTLSKLAGNTTAAIQYLAQTGTGSSSAAPAWTSISGGDITGAALTRVDDTNVTLTLGGSPTTSLLRATSITAGWSGQLSLARGGTNASLAASNGGIVYSGASAFAVLAGTATAGKFLLSGASTTPSWSTLTYSNIVQYVDPTVRVVTSGATVTVASTDGLIILNYASPAALVNFNLPAVASRDPTDLNLMVWDYAGNITEMTFTPNGVEGIMGATTPYSVYNGAAGTAQSGASAFLKPIPSLSGWVIR